MYLLGYDVSRTVDCGGTTELASCKRSVRRDTAK